MKQVRLYIEGMTCINCQYKIEKELRKQPEIESASVDYKNRTADISYNENGISTEQLIAVIDNLGYQASSGRSSGKKVLVMFQNALAYNLGRIFSYTITGGILGAAGSLTGIADLVLGSFHCFQIHIRILLYSHPRMYSFMRSMAFTILPHLPYMIPCSYWALT